VTVCHEPTQGSYAARNCGIRHARGEILAFTDADCEVCPTWIEELAQALSRPEVMVVLGGRRHATESCGLALAADYDAQKTAYVCSQSDPRLLYGYTNNQAMRRTAFEHCGPFLEVARGGDTVMVGRVAEAYGASAVRYVPAARIRHLEIDQLWDWYAKLYTYGRSYRNYRQWCDARPLTLRDRVAVLEQTIADRGYTWPKALALAALLGGGVVAYEVGRHVTWRP
jgi:glycosyltransferase involved in cell wall biosynthesis